MDIDDLDPSGFNNIAEYIAALVHHGLAKPAEDAPFDCVQCISGDFSVFGNLGSGPLRGKYVRVNCVIPEVIDPDTGEAVIVPPIGEVIGDNHGRIVVALESELAVHFFGWLVPTDFQLIDIHSETVKWLH